MGLVFLDFDRGKGKIVARQIGNNSSVEWN